jgi:hypothetical protein
MRHTKSFSNLWVEEFDNILMTKQGRHITDSVIDEMIKHNPLSKDMSRPDWLSYILHSYKATVFFLGKEVTGISFEPK